MVNFEERKSVWEFCSRVLNKETRANRPSIKPSTEQNLPSPFQTDTHFASKDDREKLEQARGKRVCILDFTPVLLRTDFRITKHEKTHAASSWVNHNVPHELEQWLWIAINSKHTVRSFQKTCARNRKTPRAGTFKNKVQPAFLYCHPPVAACIPEPADSTKSPCPNSLLRSSFWGFFIRATTQYQRWLRLQVKHTESSHSRNCHQRYASWSIRICSFFSPIINLHFF